VKRQPTVADIVMMAGGVVTFLFSFFSFWDQRGVSENAWGSFAFPLATIPAILGLAMVVVVALEVFAGVKLPNQVLTFNWKQIYVTWGVVAAVIMLGFLILSDAPDKGFGFWLMLLGSLAMAVGAILNLLGLAANPVNIQTGGHHATAGGPQPYGGQQVPPGYGQPQQQYPPQGGYQVPPPQQAPPPPPPSSSPPPPPPPPVS
jgi:hypothetical protein